MIKQTCFKIGTCILLILLIFQILPQASTGASASSAAPFVTILSPAMADTFGVYENVFLQGTSITISAEASSSEGISQMVIMDGDMAIKAFRVSEGTLSNNSNTSKISWNWTNASPGEHTITVRAYSAVTNIRSTDWTYIVVTPAVEIDEVYIGDSTAPLDGEFENYTDTTGNVLPTGWGGDTFYADGGRILAGSPGRNSSSCLYMATTDSTKNISPYIQAGNYSGLSGTLVFEMDIMRGSESNSVDLRTIVTGYVAGSSTAQILFFMKRGTFQAALKDGSYLEFGKYARNQWYNVKMVVHVLSGLMDLYIDGTKKLSGIEMRLNPANLKSIRISHASTNATGETYLDNIKFYRYEVSGPVVRDVWFTDGTGNKTEPALHIPLGTEKITLRFYDPVAPSSCAAAVRLRTDSGDAVPFSGSYNTSEKSYTLTLLQSLCPKTKYVLECGTELTDTTDSPLAYKRLWVFATEASEYKVNGPRFFSGGEEILILSEAAEGTLHITASVSQNKSAPSVITAAAAIYQNGRMTGAAMQDKTVTSLSSADFALDLDFPGYTENTEVKFFVWDNMKPVYIETLTAKRGVPIIRSGFENTTITTPDNKRYYLHGADTSLPAPNDWDALTYDPVVVSGFPHINTDEDTPYGLNPTSL